MNKPFAGVPKETIKAFNAYHAGHPEIWIAFERKALEAIRAGETRIGAKWIFEVLRWEGRIEKRNDTWAVNNNWASYYARGFIEKHPEHADKFELRETTGVKEAA